jgi:hypothetical protein
MLNEAILPSPDDHGRFRSILPSAPDHWPWALPSLYAINVAPDAQVVPSGATASGGEVEVRYRLNEAAHNLEVIGRWDSTSALMHEEHFSSGEKAEAQAQQYFHTLPVRYLMHAGVIVAENQDVPKHAAWPKSWQFRSITDVGIYFAYLYEMALAAGATEAASAFRARCFYAAPPTEQVIVLIDALEFARAHLGPYLSKQEVMRIPKVLRTLRKWLAR